VESKTLHGTHSAAIWVLLQDCDEAPELADKAEAEDRAGSPAEAAVEMEEDPGAADARVSHP
jgi:hypothetical protein